MIVFAGLLIAGGFLGIAVYYRLFEPLALLGYIAGGASALLAVAGLVAAVVVLVSVLRRPRLAPGFVAVKVPATEPQVADEVEAWLREVS